MKKQTLLILIISLLLIGGAILMATGTIRWQQGGTHSRIGSDREFIESMIPHHEEAIMSSEAIAKSTANKKVRSFAAQVISDQTREVTAMKGWYKEWYKQEYTSNHNYMVMMPDVSSLQGQEADAKYIQGMIDHHKGAIAMAQSILEQTPRKEVESLANAIIKTQSAEVVYLQNLQKELK